MAATETPAPAERIAAFDTRLFPGKALRMDWAFVLGSSWGTPELYLELVRCADTARKAGDERFGRSRAAP